MGILRRTKSFFSTPNLRSTSKAFIHRLMEYCSPLSPMGWLPCLVNSTQLDTMETKAFKIIGISLNEAESLDL